MWSGYLTLGGNEIGNSARALGYTRTSDCPTFWLRDRDCGGLVEALGQAEYTYDRITEAPWYDPDAPDLTSRFLGAYVVSLDGVSDSTRAAKITEKNTDGAQVSGYRHTSRQVRARVMLTARGMDALEAGMTWLRNALEPDACGMHGTSCGSADFGFFVDCPPTRQIVNVPGEITVQRTNLFANPRGTTTSGTYWGATLGTLSTVSDIPGDITTGVRWERTGAGDGEIRLNVGASLPEADAAIHVMLTVRASTPMSVSVSARPDVASPTGGGVLDPDPIALSAGMNYLELNGAMAGVASATAGVVLTVADGAVGSTLDITGVLIEGAPGGLYFDGNTTDDEGTSEVGDERLYDWLGDENLSQSTESTVPVFAVPETTEQYMARIDSMRRFLHTVTCISGPLIQQSFVSQDKTHYGYLVEFTLLAAVPFVFGITKTIAVPLLTPAVLQDAPFNLVTHPSAELSSSAPNMLASSGAAGTRAAIPTHFSPAGGNTSHPSVVDFGTAWNGYRYWMANAPMPAWEDDESDPNVVASTDGVVWVVPAGLTNPLDDMPTVAAPDGVNSDTELVYGPDSQLWLMWRTNDPDTIAGEEQMWLRKSADGITWSAKVLVHQDDETVRRLTSPSLIWENDGWTMYAIDTLPSPNRLVRSRMEATTMTVIGWTTPVNCTLVMPAGREPLTVEVRPVAGEYVALVSDTAADGLGLNGDLYVATSQDGETFVQSATVAVPREGGSTPGHQALRRASFVMKSATQMDVWYTGWNTGSPQVWNVFRTTLVAPSGADAVIAATNYSPNPSAEVNAADYVGGTEVVSGSDPAPYFTAGRVTDELDADGSSSFRGAIIGDGATTDAGRSYIWLSQTVPLTGLPVNTRVSFNIWGAVAIVGGAAGSTIHGVQATAEWRDGVTGLSTLTLGNATSGEFGGRAYQLDSQVKPSAADNVVVRVRFDVSWESDPDPAHNSEIQAYIDAIAVTVP